MSHEDYPSRPDYGSWGPPPQQSSGEATAALVLGICGIVLCPVICSILAIVFAKQAYNEIDASGGRVTGRGTAQAGLVLGWVGLGLWGLVILAYIAVIVIAFAITSSGSIDTLTP